MNMTNTQGETVAKAVDGGKDAEPALLHQAAEERICECGAAGSGEGHSSFCPWLSSQWKRWGDAINAPSPAPSQHTGWSEEAVEAAARAMEPMAFREEYTATDEFFDIEQEGRAQAIGRARAALTAASSISPATGFEVKADSPTVVIGYTNWRGEYAEREIVPMHPWFGSTDWHPEPQWLLKAWDVAKDAERDFAIKDIGIRSSISPTVTAKDGEEVK